VRDSLTERWRRDAAVAHQWAPTTGSWRRSCVGAHLCATTWRSG